MIQRDVRKIPYNWEALERSVLVPYIKIRRRIMGMHTRKRKVSTSGELFMSSSRSCDTTTAI